MTNEKISYEDFLARAEDLAPEWLLLLDEDLRESIIVSAWEACAWISTLTDQRIVRALREAR
jgi:hypothetical protein